MFFLVVTPLRESNTFSWKISTGQKPMRLVPASSVDGFAVSGFGAAEKP
jgi:hypothetical protein